MTCSEIRPELRAIGVIRHVEGRALDENAGDLALTAGWGHAGRGGITMPGSGKAVVAQTPRRGPGEPTSRPRPGAAVPQAGELTTPRPGAAVPQVPHPLGETTYDIYLNDRACWSNVPERVWHYTLGGYQVIKKWLSYREKDVLGRDLRPDEARYVTELARRIAAILLMEPELDANYERVKADTYPWPA